MTPVERMARAIQGLVIEAEANALAKPFAERVRHRELSADLIAQAALSALLEPSEAMVEAGVDAVLDFIGTGDAEDIFRAMITAAIAEGRG